MFNNKHNKLFLQVKKYIHFNSQTVNNRHINDSNNVQNEM